MHGAIARAEATRWAGQACSKLAPLRTREKAVVEAWRARGLRKEIATEQYATKAWLPLRSDRVGSDKRYVVGHEVQCREVQEAVEVSRTQGLKGIRCKRQASKA